MKYPCQNCPKRSAACHDTCPDYQKVKKANETAAARKRADNEFNDYVKGAKWRTKK